LWKHKAKLHKHSLIKAIVDLSAENLDITIFDGIANLPQFNLTMMERMLLMKLLIFGNW
jgi:hypothetical protein